MIKLLNATELRLGNIVSPLFGGIGIVTKLSAQKASDGTFYLIEVDNKETFIPQHVKGVELTPEILKKIGFDESKNISSPLFSDWSYKSMLLEQSEKGFELFGSEFTMGEPFNDLHRLQNLYHSLYGEELQTDVESLKEFSLHDN